MWREFDFKSIMLYPPTAFSENGKPVIVRRRHEDDLEWGIKTEGLGGATTELSWGDIEGVKLNVQTSRPLKNLISLMNIHVYPAKIQLFMYRRIPKLCIFSVIIAPHC